MPQTTDAEEAEVEWLYEDLQDLLDLLELTPKNNVLFIIGYWNTKSSKSRDTWNNRQVGPLSTKQSRAKANRVLSRNHTGQSKHSFPKIQETTLHMDITLWSILNSD